MSVASGDVGTRDFPGFTAGARSESSRFNNVDIGEILVYPRDKSAIQSDLESYLSDK